MRSVWLTAAVVLLGATTASAQTGSRFFVGPLVRVDRVRVEGHTSSVVPVFGAVASMRLSRILGIEAEITHARGQEFVHSYDGVSETFAPPNSTLEEKERLGVHARWRFGFRPGVGGAVAMTAGGAVSRRADLLFRFGLSLRNYLQSYEYTVLSIPEGIDPSRLATVSFGNGSNSGNPWVTNMIRGGLLIGVDVPIRITGRLSLAPDVRYVNGGASLDYTHKEASLGLRGGWRF